jgi:hypothetical protein
VGELGGIVPLSRYRVDRRTRRGLGNVCGESYREECQ